MSDDTKPTSSSHQDMADIKDGSQIEKGDESTKDQAPLILGEDLLVKNEEEAVPADPVSGEDVISGAEVVEIVPTPQRRGVLSRLFRRDRTRPSLDSEIRSDQAPMDQVTPEPELEDPVAGQRSGLFGRKRSEPQPGLTTKEQVEHDADPATLPDVELQEPPRSEIAIPPGPSGTPKKGSRTSKRGFPPIQVLIGWIGESSRKDVLEHARGFAEDHVETLDTAWIAMSEFRGGTLFEIHEGGSGQSYLPDLIEELSRDPEQVLWVPSGTKLNRVVTLSLVEGRPFSMMLNEADSARVRESGQAPMARTSKMRRLSPRGNAVLVVGATFFAIAMGALGTSAYLAAAIDQQPIPALAYNPEILPHGQIVSLSSALREDRWVSRIVFENGAWRAEFETFDELVLPEDTNEAQRLIEEAVSLDAILQQERERKIEELTSE